MNNLNKPNFETQHQAFSGKHQPWHRNPLVMVTIFCLFGLYLIGVMLYYVGQMEAQQTLLLIQRDSCEYLQQHKVNVQQLDNGSCKAELRFRPTLFGSGGSVFIGDSVLRMSGQQLAVIAVLEEQTYTTSQLAALILLIVSFVIMIFIMGWTVRAFNYQPEEDAE
ncbi:MAG: hypothetical protein WCI39_12690 [Gallionellaceae bacterium]